MSSASPVLLGLLDAPAPPRCQGGLPSKLGGVPDCVPSVSSAPPCCGICSAALVHLLQVACPLEGSPFQRLVHVFACARKGCWGRSESWKALRSQYLQDVGEQGSEVKQKQECTAAARDWCEGADDWGEGGGGGGDGTAALGPIASGSLGAAPESSCAKQLQGLRLSESPVPSHLAHSHDDINGNNNNTREGPAMPHCVPAFRPYYISVVDEADYLGCQDTGHAQALLQEYQRKEGRALEELLSESCASGASEEKYEKSGIGKRDQVFHRFMKRISACREQLLRYSWDGEPLLLAAAAAPAPPPCGLCRSRRAFEFQLMPTLVSVLQASGPGVSVEFGTALVFTCAKSCWPPNQATPLEEYVYVQEDPDQHLFK